MRTAITLLLVSSCLLATVQSRAVINGPDCDRSNPYISVPPRWFHKPLPGRMSQWSYDGVSPFMGEAARVKGNDISVPLVGRGDEDPLKTDPFGAGMRISTRYAYLGGKVCAWVQIPKPTSGTIFGLYLIDVHPQGSERTYTPWHEADLEWLGVKPDQVQTSVFEMGKDQPHAVEHHTDQLLNGATQEDPVRYCIEWSLAEPDNKFIRFTAKSESHPGWVVLREWKPSSPEVAAYWNEPLRAIITFWSNKSIVNWSGSYNIPQGEILWAHLRDVTFVPEGQPFCPKPDRDLQPTQQQAV